MMISILVAEIFLPWFDSIQASVACLDVPCCSLHLAARPSV